MKYLKYLLIFPLSLLIGWGVSFLSIFEWITLFIVYALLWLMLLIILILMQKKIFIKTFIIICLFGLTTSITALVLKNNRINAKMETGNKVISYLNNYFEKNGKFPNSIKELELNEDINFLYYNVENDNESFYIEFDLNGWHKMIYNHEFKEWRTID